MPVNAAFPSAPLVHVLQTTPSTPPSSQTTYNNIQQPKYQDVLSIITTPLTTSTSTSTTRILPTLPFRDEQFFSGKPYPKDCLIGLGTSSIPTISQQVRNDAKTYALPLSSSQSTRFAYFVKFGSSMATCKLGEGERRALIRDLFETLGTSLFPIRDLDRIASGETPRIPSKHVGRIRVQRTRDLLVATGVSTDQWYKKNHLAWNIVYHRVRPPRSLTAERKGIQQFHTVYNRTPQDPEDWALVRVLGYIPHQNVKKQPAKPLLGLRKTKLQVRKSITQALHIVRDGFR